MDKGIGVGLAAVAAEVLAFAGAAVFTTTLCVPSVLAAVVQQVALLVAEGGGDAVLSVGKLGTVERPSAHLGGEVSTGDAEDLSGHNVVDTLLQVGNLRFQSCQQSLGNLAQEDATFRTRVEEPCLRTAEQLLRQQVQHPISQLRRSEDLVARKISQAVQDIGCISFFHILVVFLLQIIKVFKRKIVDLFSNLLKSD